MSLPRVSRALEWFRTLAIAALFIASLASAQQQCARRSCYPATGDLLIGREDRLTATSTCGLKEKQEYCIVGFLKEQKKCFICDSTAPTDRLVSGYKVSHLPKYMVSDSLDDKLKTWWQAANGKEHVSIQLDLEAEFHFTHLIMTFKTFRPAGMIVEKSSDYNRTWSVYRYFAADCAKTFPGVKRGPQLRIDDVICEEKYSGIEPSTEGEVVMKVLDPLIPVKNPYSYDVQKLLKLTNLRVNFTKLHTLGDDALSDGPAVRKKYYYAMYEMVVRGSCSCYGHAEECIPTNGAKNFPNMVHGQCNCTHNTRGRNCELCKEGYNDLPWRPAYDQQINECQKCNCHGHTDKCHFDPAVFKATRNRSGGVCDDCKHNTTGRQCELCKPLFYRDPFKDLTDTKVCLPCDCDPSGSTGGGECETYTDPIDGTVAGRCICKENVQGRRCDTCKDGFYNLQESNLAGCRSCNCDQRGTVIVNKCDTLNGKCNCKRFVRGTTCNQCFPRYWGLGTSIDGCQPCGCDVGGAYNDNCDEITGSCECRPNIIGRKCDMPRPGYFFALMDQNRFEAEDAVPAPGSVFSVVKRTEPADKSKKIWTGDGYVLVKENSVFDFTMVRVPHSGNYDMVIRFQPQGPGSWQDVMATVRRTDGRPLSGGPCVASGTEKALKATLYSYDDSAKSTEPICLQENVVYNVRIKMPKSLFPGETILIDSIVFIPRSDSVSILKGAGADAKRQLYDDTCQRYYLSANRRDPNAPAQCRGLQFSVSSVINGGALPCQCDRVGTRANGTSDILTCEAAGGQCPCKPNVIGRTCDRCAPGAYGFSSQGCKACNCDPVASKSQFCDLTTGQCSCIDNVVGRQCNQCPANHFGFPKCRKCECNGHSTSCDPKTGVCQNCQHNTAGDHCEKCSAGYYGDATKGTSKDCSRCQCPGGSSGNQFSKTCYLDNGASPAKLVCDACERGYTGTQCEKCADGYFGKPLAPGGKCEKCNCNGNINANARGKCDSVTGECFNCQHNTTGFYCEICQKGFFGNALNRTCRECVCNKKGSDSSSSAFCDPSSGQCICRNHVVGIQCDKCEPGYWNLASGKGCQSCECDKEGSLEAQCNQLDGQCRCRTGFGGRTCSDCEDGFWGDPKASGCKACLCNPAGSLNSQCNRKTGKCKCRPGVIGDRCDMCDAQTTGVMPKCERCHPCYDQWDEIISKLEKNMTNYVAGSNISSYFATYDLELETLKSTMKDLDKILLDRRLSASDVNKFRKELDMFRKNLTSINSKSHAVFKSLGNTTNRTIQANEELDRLKEYLNSLLQRGKQLKMNMTDIAYGDVGYAYNVTLDSEKRSLSADRTISRALKSLNESKEYRIKMDKEVVNANPKFSDLHSSNELMLGQLTVKLNELERILNETNMVLCGDKCGRCTHKGCGMCGGGNCTGVKDLAQAALAKARKAEEAMRNKEGTAKMLMREVQESETAVMNAMKKSKQAMDDAMKAKRIGEAAARNITMLIKDIYDFLNATYHHPEKSEQLAKMTLALNISLTPSEITSLATQINETVRNLTNVKSILDAANDDYINAQELKRRALQAQEFAQNVSASAEDVILLMVELRETQSTATQMHDTASATYNRLSEKLKSLRADIAKLNVTLMKADATTSIMAKTADMVERLNNENRQNLTNAESATTKAVADANQAGKLSSTIKGNFSNVHKQILERSAGLDDAKRRAEKLVANARAMYLKTLAKISELEDLGLEYTKREIRAKDLADELAKLEKRIALLLKQIQTITQCHTDCNPNIEGFCEDLQITINKK
ncbi:laminin subunit beta-1-like [Rhopilema esculentum]|uniref:laminin subunit beta-1-like n=1 Tax=Rhopilema esculentum TaxID=499914 RepID=UPI0031CDE962